MIRDSIDPSAIERAAERNALLVVRLRRTSEAYHRASGHAAARWTDCSEELCLMNQRVIARNDATDVHFAK